MASKDFSMSNHKHIDIKDPKDLSIDFIKKAYDMVWYAENNPFDFEGAERYIAYGYSIKLAKCKKSSNSEKHCNLVLVKHNTIGMNIVKSQTYLDKDLDLGIIRLLGNYIKLLKDDEKI